MTDEFDKYDIPTLAAHLFSCLRQDSDWIKPLFAFQQKLVDVIKSNDPRFWEYSRPLLFQYFPYILNTCLAHSLYPNYPVAKFLEVSILTIKFTMISMNQPTLVPLLNQIFNVNQVFYMDNERVMGKPYSTYIYQLADFSVDNNIPDSLISLMYHPNYDLNSFIHLTDLMHLIKAFSSQKKDIFNDTASMVKLFVSSLNKFCLNFDDDRKISHREILQLITNISSFCKDEQFASVVYDVVIQFIDSDIAEIKLTGIKIANILYLNIASYSLNSIVGHQTALEYLLANIDNFELLESLKPVLFLFAEKNLLSEYLVECIWNIVNSMPDLLLPRSLNIFADVALKMNDCIDFVINLITNPLNSELILKFVNNNQYFHRIIEILIDMAEQKHSLDAFEILNQISQRKNISFILPKIMNFINDYSLFKSNISLIKNIESQKISNIDNKKIVETFSLYILSNVNNDINDFLDILKNYTFILSRTESVINASSLSLLINNIMSSNNTQSIKNQLIITLIINLFPFGNSLVDEESSSIIVDIVNNIKTEIEMQTNLELFDILKHLYLNNFIHNKSIKKSVYDCIWEFLMHPKNIEQRKLMSSTLLTFTRYDNLMTQIQKLVQDSVVELTEKENVNAALFIIECLDFSSRFVSLKCLGIEPHLYQDPDDLILITLNKIQTLEVNKYMKISEVIPLVSNQFNMPVMSIMLFYNNNRVDDDLIIGQFQTTNFEVRYKKQFEEIKDISRENHPISFLNKYSNILLNMLNSKKLSQEIYQILIRIPTASSYLVPSPNDLNPSNAYRFLYDLHYLTKNQNKIDKSMFDITRNILFSSFSTLLPEAQYLLTLIYVKHTTSLDDQNLLNFLDSICSDPNQIYFYKIVNSLLPILSNTSIVINENIIKSLILNQNLSFSEKLLSSDLISKQDFSKIWNIFQHLNEKRSHINILANFKFPLSLCQNIFDTLFEFLYNENHSLNQLVLQIFYNMSQYWNDFPITKILPILLENYIISPSYINIISIYPFKLLQSSIHSNLETLNTIFQAIYENIPLINEWNYQTTNNFKENRCGLSNLGSTCYVNSILQVLFSIEPLKNFIISYNFDDTSLIALQKLFTMMEYSHKKCIDMRDFINSWETWDGAHINPILQQDANEFLMQIFSKLEQYPDIFSLISGKQKTVFSGNNFNQSHTLSFDTLPLAILEMKNISDSMKNFNSHDVIKDFKTDDGRNITVETSNYLVEMPPYLFIQLKRFDYSIENGLRTKLNQYYEFDESIDFTEFMENDNIGATSSNKYILYGVIVHQGNADQGHYFCYFQQNDKWFCANDVSIKEVTYNEVTLHSYGSLTEESGYLLLYKTEDTTRITDIKINPKSNLCQPIECENRFMSTCNLYFNDNFAQFIFNSSFSIFNNLGADISAISNSQVIQVYNTLLKYYMKLLSHSSLNKEFASFSNKIIQIISQSESRDSNKYFIENIVNYMMDNDDVILSIFVSSASTEIKVSFSNVISALFSHLSPKTDLIDFIINHLDFWLPIILENWRNGFYIFKVFVDYASISTSNLAYLIHHKIIDKLFNFVLSFFPQYIQENSDTISVERFKQSIDLTYLFQLCELVKGQDGAQNIIKEILSPHFLEWCIGSTKHQLAFIHCASILYPNFIDCLCRYIDKTPHLPPFPNLVTELANTCSFKIPLQWINQYFSDPANKKYLLRALFAQFLNDYDLFPKFVSLNSEALCTFLFSEIIEVREEVIRYLQELQQISDEYSKDNSQIKNTQPIVILFPIIEKISELSKALSSNPNYKASYIPLDCFCGIQFLEFIFQHVSRLPKSKFDLSIKSAKHVLHQLIEIRLKRDEHVVEVAQISLCLLSDQYSFSHEEPKFIMEILNTEFITDIENAIFNMIPDHKLLPYLIHNLFDVLLYYYNLSILTAEQLLLENRFIEFLYLAVFSDNLIPSSQGMIKKDVQLFFKTGIQRYAFASRSFKTLCNMFSKYISEISKKMNNTSIYKNVDANSTFMLLSLYSQQIIESNIDSIAHNLQLIQYILFTLSSNPDLLCIFSKLIIFITCFYAKQQSYFERIVSCDPKFVQYILIIASNNSVEKELRLSLVPILETVMKCIKNDLKIMIGEIVLSKYFNYFEIVNYIYMLAELTLYHIQDNDTLLFLQNKIISEISETTDNYISQSKINIDHQKSFYTIFKIFNLIAKADEFKRNHFILIIHDSKILPKIWSLQPLEEFDYQGIYFITKYIIRTYSSINYLKNLEICASSYQSKFHKKLYDMILSYKEKIK